MRKDRGETQGPENIEPGINSQDLVRGARGYRPNPKTLFNFAAITTLLATSASSCEPTITPNPIDPTKPIATETFVPTEIPHAEYKAVELDITSLVEANPETVPQEYKYLQSTFFDLAKTMPEFTHFTPRIWSLSVSDNGPKIDESMILAQNQTTNEFYVLATITGSGVDSKTTFLEEKIYAEVTMGENGQVQNLSYYYLELDGTRKEFIRSNPENNSRYVYTMADGSEVALDEIPIAVGGSEDSVGGKKLLSLVPPGEDFYKNLPAGSVVNTETGQITDSSGNVIYHEDGKWKEQPVLESGEALEFSPLLPAVWSKEWIGKVGDLEIPIIIGLAEGVFNDKKEPFTPIKGVWMTQEGTDAVADAFLRATHYRYTEIMGNTATYEEYLDILKNQPHGGEVNLLITDNELDANGKAVRREALIDPRQGFSLLMSDKIDPEIGVKFNRTEDVFFGVDGQGRLLFASDHFSRYQDYRDYIESGVNIKDYTFVWNNIDSVLFFSFVNNRCLVNGSVVGTCGEQSTPNEAKDWWQIEFNKYNIMRDSGYFKPSYGLEKP